MKCQKCGSKLVSGHLYCDICGAEYQIVPNFEPEIESSIAQSMSDISESLDTGKLPDELLVETKKKKITVPSFSVIFFWVLLCSVFIYIGYSKYTGSTNYQNEQALEAFHNYDYYKAAQIYESIRKSNDNDAYWYVKEAEMRLLLEEKQEAYDLVLSAIQLNKNTAYAYEFLISYLEKENNALEINKLLQHCSYDNIKEKYKHYLSEVPSINYESGIYHEILELSFDKTMEGNIYYTLDTTEPTQKSTKYTAPITLGNGKHTLKVLYENAFGILSDVVVFEYEVVSDIPMAPRINLSSGNYSDAQWIEIDVEEGTRVYYTTDFSHPSEESIEYTAPIPMPLGKSLFKFIAISEKGICGSVIQRNFMLDIKTGITIEEAENLLVQTLISTGHLLDGNGAVQGRYGVFRYFYKFPISEEGINYYVFEEHYMENQINNPLKHFYAVDVVYGSVYKLISDGNGKFIRVEI